MQKLILNVSMIQSLSQSYLRVKDHEIELSKMMKVELDKFWDKILDECLNVNIETLKDDFYVCSTAAFFEKLRINRNELRDDLNKIYDCDSFNKLCYVIYKLSDY